MTKPRLILPGATLAVCRRNTQQTFFLTPCRKVNQAYLYLLGYTAEKYGIDLHAFCAMSNHHHLNLTDPRGNLPDFCQNFHSLLARCLNNHYDRSENFWSGAASYNACLLGIKGEADIVEYAHDSLQKMIYTIVNPVRAALVNEARKWPGANSIHYRFGQTVEFERPDWFFRAKGPMPAKSQITLVQPPGWEHLSGHEMDTAVRQATWERTLEIRRELKADGRKFLGAHTVLRQNPFTTLGPKPAEHKPIPHVASSDPKRRKQLKELLRNFRAEYKAALRAFLDGDRDAVFPHGTYHMHRRYNVRCHPAEPHPPP